MNIDTDSCLFAGFVRLVLTGGWLRLLRLLFGRYVAPNMLDLPRQIWTNFWSKFLVPEVAFTMRLLLFFLERFLNGNLILRLVGFWNFMNAKNFFFNFSWQGSSCTLEDAEGKYLDVNWTLFWFVIYAGFAKTKSLVQSPYICDFFHLLFVSFNSDRWFLWLRRYGE